MMDFEPRLSVLQDAPQSCCKHLDTRGRCNLSPCMSCNGLKIGKCEDYAPNGDGSIVADIMRYKKMRNAVILAHNYTLPEVQDIADFVGDSLGLSIQAAQCDAPVIVFCGVRFMAETAKILSPLATVLHPNPNSGCPMAGMITAADIKKYKQLHPDTIVVAYVNTTAETKSVVDICCTSGNAEKIIRNVFADNTRDNKVLFVPDQNLGAYLNKKLGKRMELWPGCCTTHNKIMPEHISAAKQAHPNALVLVHPECRPAVIELADEALSTGQMLRVVRNNPDKEFIIGTEKGIVHRMQKENPNTKFYQLEPEVVCPNMKRILLGDILISLIYMDEYEVKLDPGLIVEARRPIEKMLELSK